ncbi:DUF2804 domain-containing protein [Paenisporosarcina sp. TG-14]|uniref:DUF2804 domain-containing protein n=1 Tax=Paenisporosarcina sp. TG-14 TaxID=1231057 RepID=UPI0002E9666C|nr:DUF2804 domain-containing protein [Paenisporosarcina sp. TG-14]
MPKVQQHAEREILDPIALCDSKGNLNPAAIGFSRKSLIDSNLSGHFMRKKKWNNWCVFGEDIMFSASIRHMDYAVICSVYFLDYETQRYFEKSITVSLGQRIHMPNQVLETITFFDNEMSIQLLHMQGETHMKVTISNFDGEFLHADLQIEHPVNDESLNVVIPWNRHLFHHTAKHYTLPTSGFVKVGDKRYNFNSEDSYAVLDYGRGVWPRKASRKWASASQRLGNQRIGLNFGGTWTDGTGMTENAVFVDGQVSKISEDVIFTYDKNDLMNPWHIRSKFSSDVNLTFTPFLQREANINIGFVNLNGYQMVGYFNGFVHLHDGSCLFITELLGSIEDHKAKW